MPSPRYPLVLQPMYGLGDSIYQRPFVRLHAADRGEVFVRTPWPELFEDIPSVRFVAPQTSSLRTQKKNADRQEDERWVRAPVQAERIRGSYGARIPTLTILQELAESYRIGQRGALPFDLPDFGSSPVRYKRYAVVRPVTLRKEWANPARAPEPAYVNQAVGVLKDLGYRIVAVADIDPPAEWLVGESPAVDKSYLRGELDTRELLALTQHATLVVGGVGWIVPAGLAQGTPTIVIGGGNGAHNAPEVVTDRRLDTSTMRFLLPDPYCRCADRWHECPKAIPDFEEQFIVAHDELLPAERTAAA